MSDLIRRCSLCPRMTRPSRTLVAEYPGTSQRHGGMCMTCYRASQRAIPNPTPRPSHAYNVAGLTSFLARRHARKLAHARADHLATYLTERASA